MIRAAVLCSLASCFFLSACGTAEIPDSSGDESLSAEIRGYLAPHVEAGDFSGTILVSKPDHVLASLAFGNRGPDGAPNSLETRHHIASLSKAFTATALLLLVEEGVVSLDDSLAHYVPEFPQGDRITLHHLLTHTSGIPDINRFPEYRELSTKPQELADLLTVIIQHSAEAAPSSSYRYSNSNYNVLAFVIESASGQSYAEFMAQRVFEPLALDQTAHSGSARDRALPTPAAGQVPIGLRDSGPAPYLDWSIKTGNGSIVSTAEDLSLFLHRLFDRPLLSDETRDLMLQGHVDDRYAYGWFTNERFGRRAVYLNGNTPGVSASFEYYPGEQLAVVVLANHDIALASGISSAIAAMVFGEPVDPPISRVGYRPQGGIPSADFVGKYDFGVGFEISTEGGTVVARGAWPRYPTTLVPIGEDLFYHRFWSSVLEFERGADGSVTALVWGDRKAERRLRQDGVL